MSRLVTVAVIQFDAIPEEREANLCSMERLAEEAVQRGARWVLFHENTVCDYTPRVEELAEEVPEGASCRRIGHLAKSLDCRISMGLVEKETERYYITQAFFGPEGFVHKYRKTWIFRTPGDAEYRDEWSRFDPGTGPEAFDIDGVRAACFICADGASDRCVARTAALHPQVVFYPNNRASLGNHGRDSEIARRIGAPLLVSNRVGYSWKHACDGGSRILSAEGELLAQANREGREEILLYDLRVNARTTKKIPQGKVENEETSTRDEPT